MSPKRHFTDRWPRSIPIGGMAWTVEYLRGPVDEGGNDGECDPVAQHIRINRDHPPEYVKRLLIHEIIHAFLFDADYVHHSEKMVKHLAASIQGLFQNAPAVVAILSKTNC